MADAATPYDMSQGISAAFGDNTEEEARKKRERENSVSAAWAKMKSMGKDAKSGLSDMASDPGGVYKALTGGG